MVCVLGPLCFYETWTRILRSTLSLTLPLKPMEEGGEKSKFKVKVEAENMGPDVDVLGNIEIVAEIINYKLSIEKVDFENF